MRFVSSCRAGSFQLTPKRIILNNENVHVLKMHICSISHEEKTLKLRDFKTRYNVQGAVYWFSTAVYVF